MSEEEMRHWVAQLLTLLPPPQRYLLGADCSGAYWPTDLDDGDDT